MLPLQATVLTVPLERMTDDRQRTHATDNRGEERRGTENETVEISHQTNHPQIQIAEDKQ